MNFPLSFLPYFAIITLYALTIVPRTDFLSGREALSLTLLLKT
jgi:hypothetical protein